MYIMKVREQPTPLLTPTAVIGREIKYTNIDDTSLAVKTRKSGSNQSTG